MGEQRNPLNTTAGLSRLIKSYKIAEQNSICPRCVEALSGSVDLVMKAEDAEIIMENVEVIHHRCLYKAMQRKHGRITQLAQASNSSDKQSSDTQKDNGQSGDKQAVKPKRLTLACSLHAERKSEVYLAKTCKHFLCIQCELDRQTQSGCPACKASAAEPKTNVESII